MTNKSRESDRLDALTHMSCDGRLDSEGHLELERLLQSDDAAAKRYVELVQIWTGLMDWAEVETAAEESSDLASKGVLSIPRPRHKYLNFWTGFGCLAASLAAAFMLGVYSNMGAVSDQDVVDAQAAAIESNRNESVDAGHQPTDSNPDHAKVEKRFVARVVEVSPDAAWGERKPEEFLLRLTEGDQLDLQAGFAHIEFAQGASVILHGPTSFEVLDVDAGRLVSGRITGRAKDGNFTLLTEMAEVIDLGTEFGVAIDGESNTDVCVFDGEVNVKLSREAIQGQDNRPVRLTQGMALRVEPGGSVNDAASIPRAAFQRHGSSKVRAGGETREISLVDIIAGGDGMRSRVAGAIDPRLGGWDIETPVDPEGYRNRYGDGTYHASDVSPLIDGVFIPQSDGSDTQIDSSGAKFDFGQHDKVTWGPIWSRRHVPGLQGNSKKVSDFWGTQTLGGILGVVEKSRDGVVGLHASVGLTMDLRAVRMLKGRAVTRFQTAIANLDNSAQRPPQYAIDYRPSVDFWVFLDGKLLYERHDFGRDGGKVDVDLPLSPSNRFLTLVSTDAGNTYSFDHLVLIDPVLVIESP